MYRIVIEQIKSQINTFIRIRSKIHTIKPKQHRITATTHQSIMSIIKAIKIITSIAIRSINITT
jgi:hypothetical protein